MEEKIQLTQRAELNFNEIILKHEREKEHITEKNS
jgi:hypothetical protein